MHRCYFTEPVAPGETLSVDGDEARHVIQALRARCGEALELLNGQGRIVHATVDTLERRSFTCEVTQVEDVPRTDRSCTVVQALLKSGNFETVIQKAVELGVDTIIPLMTDHTISRAEKAERWEAVSISSMKQSGNPWLPKIHPVCDVDTFIEQHAPAFDRLLLADLNEAAGSFKAALEVPKRSTACLIGPEGDFTDVEREALIAAGALPVSLGPHVMRSETAALFAMSVMRYETST